MRDAEENADHLCDLRFFGVSERGDAHFDVCGRIFEERDAVSGACADGDAAGVSEFYGGIGVFLVEYPFESDLVGLHLCEIFREESVDMEQSAGERLIAQNEAIRVDVMQTRTILFDETVAHIPGSRIDTENAFDGHD